MCRLSSDITRDMPRLMAQGENHPFVICEDFREVDGASEILEQTSSDILDQMNEVQYLNQFQGIPYPFYMGSRLPFLSKTAGINEIQNQLFRIVSRKMAEQKGILRNNQMGV